jgi:hypothetical protein
MAHPFHHALSSVKRWGGQVADYLAVHEWFDESKAHLADVRHRALRHHSEGIALCERVFGKTLTNSAGRVVPVRWVGEQHVKEDLGWIPTVKDWLQNLRLAPWMGKAGQLAISEEEHVQGEIHRGQEEDRESTGSAGAREDEVQGEGERPAERRRCHGHRLRQRHGKPAGAG